MEIDIHFLSALLQRLVTGFDHFLSNS